MALTKYKQGIKKSIKIVKSITTRHPDILINIDSPKSINISENKFTIDGWVIPTRSKVLVKGIKVQLPDGTIKKAQHGIKRPDVSSSHPELDSEKALLSGFSIEILTTTGVHNILIDFGGGYKIVKSIDVVHSKERLASDYYNPALANTMSEHLNLTENKKAYFHETKSPSYYRRDDSDPRIVALYLPQFHPIEENSKVWGEGFTEWSNVTQATPRFVGHQQPILPADLGFYDLRLESTMIEQINLAKKYGVYGFTFYYYWFSGHRLLEKPLDSFIKNKDWNFNFSICWANENWTKRWDGRDSEVIIAQKYREEDPLEFIKDVAPILNDSRYITEDGKPVLMVYRLSELRNPKEYSKVWRKYFREKHNKELHLVSVVSFDDEDPRNYGFDAALDFMPLSNFFKTKHFTEKKLPFMDVSKKLIDPNFEGMVVDYRKIMNTLASKDTFSFPTYKCIMPSWDNDARKKGKGFVYYGSNPDTYARSLDTVMNNETKKRKSPLVFINAWNEWAEGTVMEPSVHLGHSVLKRTAETLSKYSLNTDNRINFSAFGYQRTKGAKLAVVLHLFYPEMWEEIKKRINNISEPYDLFISITEKDKDFIEKIKVDGVNITTIIVPNRGRDVLPFLFILNRLNELGYEYLLKLHSKKSKHRNDGNNWFNDVISSLLPNTELTKEVIKLLKDSDTGYIGPENHVVSLKRHMGSNKEKLQQLIETIYNRKISKKVIANPEKFSFFGGTMFWARLDSLAPINDLCLSVEDFQSESGQIDGTTAHAIERLFGVISVLENKKTYTINSNSLKILPKSTYNNKYDYAP